MSQDNIPVYQLTLSPTPGNVPATIRLRKALKALLRVYGLRCTSVAQVNPTTETGVILLDCLDRPGQAVLIDKAVAAKALQSLSEVPAAQRSVAN